MGWKNMHKNTELRNVAIEKSENWEVGWKKYVRWGWNKY
jgi:hypothetical protein